MADTTEALLALLRAIDPRVRVDEGGTPKGAAGPAVALYAPPGTPSGRRIDGRTRRATTTWLAVCSSNSAPGARIVAKRVIDAVDGTRLEGVLMSAPLVGPVIEDRDDPSEYRWSCTVEIHHHHRR